MSLQKINMPPARFFKFKFILVPFHSMSIKRSLNMFRPWIRVTVVLLLTPIRFSHKEIFEFRFIANPRIMLPQYGGSFVSPMTITPTCNSSYSGIDTWVSVLHTVDWRFAKRFYPRKSDLPIAFSVWSSTWFF